ncbi:hypothetical protein LIER_39940 [Lithospermum erythrorhizon]|uniref:Reverse transcriptase n=1 Tax=Lithospermum erythrorhizon TaxID=34254 RepID=A0AAV3QQE8_LITER
MVDAKGLRGGLALLWPRHIHVEIKSFSTHHIEANVSEGNAAQWRKHSWNLMRLITWLSNLPTIFMGDFNEVTSSSEHVSQRLLRSNWQMENFSQVIREYLVRRESKVKSRFKFEEGWCLYEESRDIVQKAWDKNRVPGPDGMPARFFQHYWDTVGDTLCSMVLNFLNNGVFLKKFNFTLITLISKVDRPLNMTQFKPIALCNMVTKVIAKVLVDRLERFLPSVILETRSALVLGGNMA